MKYKIGQILLDKTNPQEYNIEIKASRFDMYAGMFDDGSVDIFTEQELDTEFNLEAL